MKQKIPNQLFRDLMGVSGLNPWDGNDSSSRKQMYASHIGQILVINGSTERFCQTGMEREYGKYTFKQTMPVDAEVIKVIQRYPPHLGENRIAMNPQTIVIYEDVNTKEVGMLDLRDYCSYHQYFGFEYKRTRAWFETLRTGALIAAGTVLMDSPSITEDGGYKYGRECNMAFMSHPAVSEDGIAISEDVLPLFSFKTYETRVVEWGSKRFPLNLYGTPDNFKPFPDVGDLIRPDGLLMALRSYNKELAVVQQGIYDLMEPDFIFDKLIYPAGPGKEIRKENGTIVKSGRIIDIRIQRGSHG